MTLIFDANVLFFNIQLFGGTVGSIQTPKSTLNYVIVPYKSSRKEAQYYRISFQFYEQTDILQWERGGLQWIVNKKSLQHRTPETFSSASSHIGHLHTVCLILDCTSKFPGLGSTKKGFCQEWQKSVAKSPLPIKCSSNE